MERAASELRGRGRPAALGGGDLGDDAHVGVSWISVNGGADPATTPLCYRERFQVGVPGCDSFQPAAV